MSLVACLPPSVEAQEVREGQVVLEVQWVAWEAEVVTGAVALPQEGHADPEETLLVEEMSSTGLETGSAPTRAVETRTLPGEQNATSARLQSPKASFHHPSRHQVAIAAGAAPAA